MFKFIDETLKSKYCIRSIKNLKISICYKNDIKKPGDIIPLKGKTKHFYNIKLTSKNYVCSMAVHRAKDSDDIWFITNNLKQPFAIREYKKRFDIEEMFRDFKSGVKWFKRCYYSLKSKYYLKVAFTLYES